MYFNVVSSGSKGNATLVVAKNTTILIDMGISLVRLKAGLEEINKKLGDIDALFITHEHTDHVNGLKHFSPKKIYSLEGTLGIDYNVISAYTKINIKDIDIIPFFTSHDAHNPCGYVLECEDEKLVYMTDTGVFYNNNLPYLSNPNYLIIESNHDVGMLLKTHRTYELKCRIMSDVGHLCNEDSAIVAKDIIGDKTKEIVLAHLSEEANTSELALKAYHDIFKHFGIREGQILIRCANQHHSLIGGCKNEN